MLLKHITCTLSCGIHSFTWVSIACGSPSSRRIVPGLQSENKRGLGPNKYPPDIRCIWRLIILRVPSQGTTIFPMKVWTPGWYYFLERESSAEKALPRPAYSAASHSQNQPAALVHHCTILCLPPSTPPDFHWQIPGTGMFIDLQMLGKSLPNKIIIIIGTPFKGSLIRGSGATPSSSESSAESSSSLWLFAEAFAAATSCSKCGSTTTA